MLAAVRRKGEISRLGLPETRTPTTSTWKEVTPTRGIMRATLAHLTCVITPLHTLCRWYSQSGPYTDLKTSSASLVSVTSVGDWLGRDLTVTSAKWS